MSETIVPRCIGTVHGRAPRLTPVERLTRAIVEAVLNRGIATEHDFQQAGLTKAEVKALLDEATRKARPRIADTLAMDRAA